MYLSNHAVSYVRLQVAHLTLHFQQITKIYMAIMPQLRGWNVPVFSKAFAHVFHP